jgi:hypothetical protein
MSTHSLLILDINSLKIINRTCISSNLKLREHIRKS